MEEQYMFGYEDALQIRKTVFDLLHFDWAGTIDVHQGDGLHICMKNGHAAITAQDKPALARASSDWPRRPAPTRPPWRCLNPGILIPAARSWISPATA